MDNNRRTIGFISLSIRGERNRWEDEHKNLGVRSMVFFTKKDLTMGGSSWNGRRGSPASRRPCSTSEREAHGTRKPLIQLHASSYVVEIAGGGGGDYD